MSYKKFVGELCAIQFDPPVFPMQEVVQGSIRCPVPVVEVLQQELPDGTKVPIERPISSGVLMPVKILGWDEKSLTYEYRGPNGSVCEYTVERRSVVQVVRVTGAAPTNVILAGHN